MLNELEIRYRVVSQLIVKKNSGVDERQLNTIKQNRERKLLLVYRLKTFISHFKV